jgi:hypothetical protein
MVNWYPLLVGNRTILISERRNRQMRRALGPADLTAFLYVVAVFFR